MTSQVFSDYISHIQIVGLMKSYKDITTRGVPIIGSATISATDMAILITTHIYYYVHDLNILKSNAR